MTYKPLLEQAAALVAQARQKAEEFEGKELPADVATQINELLAKAKELKARADQLKEIDELTRYFSEPVHTHPILPTTSDPKSAERKAAFLEAIRKRGTHLLSPEKKALVEDANGEILVPEELEREIVRALPKITVVRQLATVLPVTTNRLRRRSMNEVQVAWSKLETGGSANDSMPSAPGEEFQYVEDLVGLAKVGVDELADSDVALEAFIRDSFARAMGEAEDTAFVIGTGHANGQPEGILHGSVVPRVNAGQAAAVTADDFLKLIYAVPAQYRRNGAFIMASSTELALRLLKDSNGQYLWQPSLQEGRPNTFAGFPIYNQEDVPAIPAAGVAADVAIFGDVRAAYRILDRQGMTIKVLDQPFATQGLVGYLATRRVGGAVIRPDALRILHVPA